MSSMWIAITMISMTAIISGLYYDKKPNKKERDEELNQLRLRLDLLESDLRERVETLERIVTDRKEDLRRQFDYLDKAS